ncbi:hypothetical protein ACO0SA_004655 [Hanseniaspora valbyensis]
MAAAVVKVKPSNAKKLGKNIAKKVNNKKQIAIKLPKSKAQDKNSSNGTVKKTAHKDKKATKHIKPLLPENLTTENNDKVVPILPINFLVSLYGEVVQIHLKFNNAMYKGELVSIDEYFNLRLKNAVEYISGKEIGKIGDCFIRCNTVLFINQKKD